MNHRIALYSLAVAALFSAMSAVSASNGGVFAWTFER
jgi:hypothetical protein